MSCCCLPCVGHKITSKSKFFTVSNLPPLSLKAPKNPSYSIAERDSIANFGACEKKIEIYPNYYTNKIIVYPWLRYTAYKIMNYDKKGNIIVIHIQNIHSENASHYSSASSTSTNKNNQNLTMIYCHKNDEDLGGCLGFLFDLCTITKNDIIAFDYTGFGCSEGNINEEYLKTDIVTVLNFVVFSLGINKKQIYIMAESIGSISAIYLSSLNEFSSILGIILGAPELTQEMVGRLEEIKSHVFIIHGINDELIPHDFIVSLGKKIQNFWNWYPSKGNHYNIFSVNRKKFIAKLRIFIKTIEERNINKSEEKEVKYERGGTKEVNIQRGYMRNAESVAKGTSDQMASPVLHMYVHDDLSYPKNSKNSYTSSPEEHNMRNKESPIDDDGKEGSALSSEGYFLKKESYNSNVNFFDYNN